MRAGQASLNKKALFGISTGVLLLGTGPMFIKFINANGTLVAFYRLLFASLMLILPASMSRKNQTSTSDKDKSILWILLGGGSFAINIGLWCTALNYTSASIVTLLDNTAPVWVGLFGWLVLGKSRNKNYWLGLCMALIGSILLVGSSRISFGSHQFLGNMLSLASGFSFAAYILITQHARRMVSSIRYSWLVCSIGALLLFIFGSATGALKQTLSLQGYLLIFLMSLSSQVLGWYLVNDTLGKLPAAAVSVAMVGQPLIVTILGIFILREIPTFLQVIGGVVCLAGILIVQRSFNRLAN
ncbi:MAG: EamA family transporter [Anaerolineaceae bacterium]|nr:EamA family transporter [Anaerolineaceae bacterium]